MDEHDPVGPAVARALAAAACLDLAIDPALLPGVAVHLDLLARHGLKVLDFPLDDRCEAAPVFRP